MKFCYIFLFRTPDPTFEKSQSGSTIRIHIANILDVSEITANLYCNCVHLYWEGCEICSNLWNALYFLCLGLSNAFIKSKHIQILNYNILLFIWIFI